MVSAASPAPDGQAQGDPLWLKKIARWLRLGRDKVAILVEEACPGGVRPLIRSLLEQGQSPRVCFHAPELLDVPEGGLVVLQVQLDELVWLNLNRPLVATRRLRLLLWLTFPLHELKGGAPDFFDWISHVVRCPEQPPAFAVRGLQAARAAGRPLSWRGTGLDLAAAGAEIELSRVRGNYHFDPLVDKLARLGERVPVFTDWSDRRRMVRAELLMRQASRPFALIEHGGPSIGGWVEFEGDPLPWSVAVSRLEQISSDVERSRLAQVVALMECEPAAIRVFVQAWQAGTAFEGLWAIVREAEDAGVVLVEQLAKEELELDVPSSIAVRAGRPSRLARPLDTLVRRHADALATDRSAAWVRAADEARIAGQPDVALTFGRRAVQRAVALHPRRRATIALAAAYHAAGDYGRAHRLFDELLEMLEAEYPSSLLLGLLLTEQALLLAEQGQHEDAAVSSHHAIQIWERHGRRALTGLHLEALRIHGRSLVANGDLSGHAAFMARTAHAWSATPEGSLYHQLERVRGRSREALLELRRELDAWPVRRPEGLSFDFAGLLLHAGEHEWAAEVSLALLRSVGDRWGTDVHPRGVDARIVAAQARSYGAFAEAWAYLQDALAICRELYHDVLHRQTLEVMGKLAALSRAYGNLESSLSWAEQARRLVESDRLQGDGAGSKTRLNIGALFDVAEMAGGGGATGPRHASGFRSLLNAIARLFAPYLESDRELLARVAAGDFHAQDQLEARHLPVIWRFFDEQTDKGVDDLVQRTFVVAWKGSSRYRDIDSFRSFLLRVARNVLAEHIRRDDHRAVDIPFEDETDEQEQLRALLPEPDDRLDEHEGKTILLQALLRIPKDDQYLLELYYWERRTGPEIAALFGIMEPVIRSRLRHAIQRLQRALVELQDSPANLEPPTESLKEWSERIRAEVSDHFDRS